jgi:hypothetical protein
MININGDVIDNVSDLKELVEKDITILNNFEYKHGGNIYRGCFIWRLISFFII